MKKIVVVMPVANEEETMADIIEETLKVPYDNLFLYPIIDNYSKDRTEEIIRKYEKTGRVKCIFYKESKGVVSCYLEGFRQALKDNADYVIEMDGGGSHNPNELYQFIEYLEKGYDCVWGSRFIKDGQLINDPLYRKAISKFGTVLANVVLGTKLHDMTSGYEAFQADILRKFDFSKFLSTGHMYQTEMRYYCRNYKTIEVPIKYKYGSSSLKMKSVFEALKILFILKNNEKEVFNTGK